MLGNGLYKRHSILLLLVAIRDARNLHIEVPTETMEKISSFPKLRSVTVLSYFYSTSRLKLLFNLPELRELHFKHPPLHRTLKDLPENHLEALSFVDAPR